jgi:pimeloyl-ACP methyl ester carboxylesterase
MARFLLLPGAGSDSWYWHAVVPLLEAAGHAVSAPDLPTSDPAAGFPEYLDAALATVPGRGRSAGGLVVVGQSMGAFTAVMAAERLGADVLVLVCPMIPAPGETGGEWWANTGQEQAQRACALEEGRDPDAEFDPVELFLHDVPAAVREQSVAHVRDQSDAPFATAWLGPWWPQAATKVIAGRFDRLFPLPFMRRVSRERLGIEPDIIDTGHLPALARPEELAARLLQYTAEAGLEPSESSVRSAVPAERAE